MGRSIATFLIALASMIPSSVWAGPETGNILLTSGVVKRVDLEKGLVILDSGRVIAVRLIQRDGKPVELEGIKPNDDVFVSGNDLGFSAELASRRAR